jgi:hypothetical protein
LEKKVIFASEDEVEERDNDCDTEKECEGTGDEDSAADTNYFWEKIKLQNGVIIRH